MYSKDNNSHNGRNIAGAINSYAMYCIYNKSCARYIRLVTYNNNKQQ